MTQLSSVRVDPETGDLMGTHEDQLVNIGRAFPTLCLHKLLWIWPSSGPEAQVEAMQKLPSGAIMEALPDHFAPGSPDETHSSYAFGDWYARDLPVGYDMILENLLDPSHLPFSHHGYIGRREMEKGTTMTLAEPLSINGYSARMQHQSGVENTVHFVAPCLVKYEKAMRASATLTTGEIRYIPSLTVLLYAVPTRQGYCRVLVGLVKDLSQAKPVPFKLMPFLEQQFPWLGHIAFAGMVLDGDTYMIHLSERLLKGGDRGGQWRQMYYMPSSVDVPVITLRRWLEEYGREMPGACMPALKDIPCQLDKRVVLDRYEQHTKNCQVCMKALAGIDLLLALSKALSLVTSSAAVALVVGQGLNWAVGALGSVCLLVLWAHHQLRRLRQMFLFVDYDHGAQA